MSPYGMLLLTFCDSDLRIKHKLIKALLLDMDFVNVQKTAEALGIRIVF